MTLNEISVQFDILSNNISSNQSPGLTEYEKSVFLTQAQEAVILDLYKGTLGEPFEGTEEVTRYLSSLVKSKSITLPYALNGEKFLNFQSYYVPTEDIKDLWFITYQSASIIKNDSLERDVLVVPTTQDRLHKELDNPFKGPNENRVLCTSEGNNVIIYSKYPVNSYYIKYLSRPYPIILEDLTDDLTINGETESKQIDWLPESLHTTILLRAVQMAKAVWVS